MTITVTSLSRTFGEKRAVDDVSFEVGPSEFFVLVGPSGCGKTTTLRLLAGLETVGSGEIRLGGRVVNDVRPRDRDVAMVFQDYAVFPHLNVYENIAYGLRSRHVSRSIVKKRVPDAAGLFRIDHLLTRKPRQLSGGERQRVALARALVRDATAYLYDEPLSNLDAQLRHQAREDILTLHRRQQKPTVFVTHDQSEAMAMGDRIAVMSGGTVQQIGTGRDLYEKPRNKFVAFFLGTPSINLFTCDVELDAEGHHVVSNSALRLRLPDSLRDVVGDRVGRQLTLGIRPEDLHPPRSAPFEVTEHNTIHGVVDLIEPTTTGSSVYLRTVEEEAQDFTATFKNRLPASYSGREVPLAVDVSKVHLFDIDTERSLVHG